MADLDYPCTPFSLLFFLHDLFFPADFESVYQTVGVGGGGGSANVVAVVVKRLIIQLIVYGILDAAG